MPLNDSAWELVKPERTRFGDEPLGLALARRAFERASDGEKHIAGDTIAWGLFALGRDEEALAAGKRALESAPEKVQADFEESLRNLERAVEEASSNEALRRVESRLTELEARRAELDARVDERRDWQFPEEERETRWWHNQLTKLIEGLERLEEGLLAGEDAVTQDAGWSIPHRLALAERLRDGFAPDGEYSRRWQQAMPHLRAVYAGIELVPQPGLVPLGPDSSSGLWEFADLSTGEEPERGSDGELSLRDETGLVFVLLPGGVFRMGAQNEGKGAPNYDPQVSQDEMPVHEVELSPFFLSKYEMTQAQWQRVTGAQPSYYGPEHWDVRWNEGESRPSLTHPVEKVSWSECSFQCARLGLLLPSEAQWEYAVRGGEDTPWWFGSDESELDLAGNVRDARAKETRLGSDVPYAPWSDGAMVHMPVDAQAPTPFGLHGMLGNVWEWCADGFYDNAYRLLPKRDPVAPGNAAGARVRRGGSFGTPHSDTRSANRGNSDQDAASPENGLRPARALQR
jgi:formylglycine-generating enzyme required for sulfatase activity